MLDRRWFASTVPSYGKGMKHCADGLGVDTIALKFNYCACSCSLSGGGG